MNRHLPAPKLHPAMLAAALSVSGFALAGIGVLTGTLPFAPRAAEPVAQTAAAPAALPAPVAAPIAKPAAPTAKKPAARAAATTGDETTSPAPTRPAAGGALQRTAATNDAQTVTHEPLGIDVTGKPAARAAETRIETAAAEAAPTVCRDCGVVEAVDETTKDGEATGLGAVGGAVVGGLLGSLIGKGHGNDAAKVLGAVGGGYAGHQIEKNVRKQTHYEVVVRFDDGTTRRMPQATAPSWHRGDRVKLVNGVLTAGG